MSLFPMPDPMPVGRPDQLDVGVGPIKYSAYTVKAPHRCDDCVRVLYEANRKGAKALPARQARFTRKQGGTTVLLCAEHKHLRENDELEQAVLAEVARHQRR